MPSNIAIIERTYELPGGDMLMYAATSDDDAVLYANGRQAYIYRSRINGCIYLFVPVVETFAR